MASEMVMKKISINKWLFGRIKEYAEENGMSFRGAVRYILSQFFKNNP